jgi:SAM-dependent methyltransferase
VVVDYEGRMAEVYNAGRSLGPEAIAVWVDLARQFVGDGPGPMLDLGAGTGRFSVALAGSLDSPIVALEPAKAMQVQAKASLNNDRVLLISGSAEHIPLRDQCVRVIWASQVLHHLDIARAASEIYRVLDDSGTVLVRGVYSDPEKQWPLVQYFPEMLAVDDAYFPTWLDMRESLERVGLAVIHSEQVERSLAGGLAELYERTRHRADSGLALLDDADFDKGLAKLASEVRQHPDQPVIEIIDLFVFRHERC